jgi:hypothetical protein
MPNKILHAPETALTFKDSGGSAVITLANLAFGAGRVSAQYDRGSGSKAGLYIWRGQFQFATAPAIAELIELYLFGGDGSVVDGTVGTADAALTSDKRRNGWNFGTVVVDTTSTNTDCVGSGVVEIYDRYISIGVWNGSAGDNLRNTANTSIITLTPVPPEIQ